MPSAEVAYLFRHVLLRDAAYELQLPRARAQLHALALDVLLEALSAAQRPDSALELARHAQIAGSVAEPDERLRLGLLELDLLQDAFAHAHARFRHADALSALQRQIEHPLNPPRRLPLLLGRRAEQLRESGRCAEALVIAREALRLPGDDPGVVPRLLHTIAAAEETLGNYAESEQACRQALALPGADRATRRKLLAALCINLTLLERHAEAESSGLELLTQAQGDDERAHALQLLGNLYDKQNRLEDAQRATGEALALHERAASLLGQAITLINLGVIARRRNEMQQAQDLYRRALSITRAIGHRRQEGVCLNNLAAVLPEDPDSVIECRELYLQALGIVRDVGDLRRECFVLNGLSETCRTLGHSDEARQYAEAGLVIGGRIGSGQLMAVSKYLLAMAHYKADDFAEAELVLVEALPQLRAERHPGRLSNSLLVLADCLRRQGRETQAREIDAEADALAT